MPEISIFKITSAKAEATSRGLRVTLVYPKNPLPIEKRLPENLTFGKRVMQELIEKGSAKIADDKNPLPPPSSGAIYLLKDNAIICSRRDRFAPTHKLWHEAYAGFPENIQQVYSRHGLERIGLRECTEECILITNEKNPKLIIPNIAAEETRKSASELGLELEELISEAEIIEGNDELVVCDESSNILFRMDAFINFSFESGTVFNILKIIKLPFTSEEVVPIDGEFIMKNGEKIRLNREAYILPIGDIDKINFGEPLKNFKIFQSGIKNGKVSSYTPKYNSPFFGPDLHPSTNPHIWAPDNNLTRLLDGLGIKCRINGKNYHWTEFELAKYELKISNSLFNFKH